MTCSQPSVGVRVVRQRKSAHTFDKSGDRSALEGGRARELSKEHMGV